MTERSTDGTAGGDGRRGARRGFAGRVARALGALALAAVATAGGAAATHAGRAARPVDRATAQAAAEWPIALRVHRVRPSAARWQLASNGIPLPPGALRPGAVARVQLEVRGEPQRAWVRPLAGTHADGSLRAVYVQFPVDFGADASVPARLVLADRPVARPDSAPVAPPAEPEAAALPVSATYLVRTDLVGPTRTVAETATLGAPYARYDADFARFADRRWRQDSSKWTSNYYDRALIYYAMWVRTGDVEYWRRGTEQAAGYRDGYLARNRYKPSPHWAQLEGVATHYWATGDEASRTAVARAAESLWGQIRGKGLTHWDQRIAGRVMLGQLLAQRLDGAEGFRPRYGPASWAARLDSAVDQIARWQQPDGRYDTGAYWCGGQANYMVGLLNEALVKVHTYHRPDPRIVTLVRRASDYMWETQWDPAAQGFNYVSVTCRGRGHARPAGDLNGLIVAPYGWLYRQTGEAKYRAEGEAIFAGLVRHAYLRGTKQFNQAYTGSYHYLAWR